MRLIDYGKITKSHGLGGGLKVVPFSGETAGLCGAGRVFIKTADGKEPESFEIMEKNVGGKSAVIKLAGVETKQDAEKFRGLCVMIAASDLPEPEKGEYYNFQLVGLLAIHSDGSEIGRVESILQSGFQSILVVSTNSGELLVPMVEKFIVDISLANGKVVVRNTESLC